MAKWTNYINAVTLAILSVNFILDGGWVTLLLFVTIPLMLLSGLMGFFEPPKRKP